MLHGVHTYLQQYRNFISYYFRCTQSPRNTSNAFKMKHQTRKKQEVQLSQRDRATFRVIEYFTKSL